MAGRPGPTAKQAAVGRTARAGLVCRRHFRRRALGRVHPLPVGQRVAGLAHRHEQRRAAPSLAGAGRKRQGHALCRRFLERRQAPVRRQRSCRRVPRRHVAGPGQRCADAHDKPHSLGRERRRGVGRRALACRADQPRRPRRVASVRCAITEGVERAGAASRRHRQQPGFSPQLTWAGLFFEQHKRPEPDLCARSGQRP